VRKATAKKATKTAAKKLVKKTAAKAAVKKAVKKVTSKKSAKTVARKKVAKSASKTIKTKVKKTAKVVVKRTPAKKSANAKRPVVKPTRKAAKLIKKPAQQRAKSKVAAKTPARKSAPKTPAAKKPQAKKRTARNVSQAVFVKQQVAHQSYTPLVDAILQQLDDAKAEQIVTIDLADKSAEADYMIVASGRSNRHVNAIADQVVDRLHKQGQRKPRVEGIPQCDWVLVDAGDVIIHVFRPEVRGFYNLEKLWAKRSPDESSGSV
jgi:ribosome-associated protein